MSELSVPSNKDKSQAVFAPCGKRVIVPKRTITGEWLYCAECKKVLRVASVGPVRLR